METDGMETDGHCILGISMTGEILLPHDLPKSILLAITQSYLQIFILSITKITVCLNGEIPCNQDLCFPNREIWRAEQREIVRRSWVRSSQLIFANLRKIIRKLKNNGDDRAEGRWWWWRWEGRRQRQEETTMTTARGNDDDGERRRWWRREKKTTVRGDERKREDDDGEKCFFFVLINHGP